MHIDPYREFWRRHHRVLGFYLVAQAWKRKLDCIVLERNDVNAYLMLSRVEKVRLQWIREDLEPWFQYQVPRYRKGTKTFHSLYLSRVELVEELFKGSLSTKERIEKLKNAGVKTGSLLSPSDTVRIREDEMLPYLAGLAAGLQDPK